MVCGACMYQLAGTAGSRAASVILALDTENRRLAQRLEEAIAQVQTLRAAHEAQIAEYAEEIAGIRASIAEMRRAREERERAAVGSLLGELGRELGAAPPEQQPVRRPPPPPAPPVEPPAPAEPVDHVAERYAAIELD